MKKYRGTFPFCILLLSLTGCQGNSGSQGPAGPVSLASVHDKNGTYLGRFASALSGGFCLFIGDGPLSCVDINGAFLGVLGPDFSFGGFGCYYASANCTGTCKVDMTVTLGNSLLNGAPATTLYMFKGTEASEGSFNYNSRVSVTGICATASGTINPAATPTAFTMPTGISFPLQMPLTVSE